MIESKVPRDIRSYKTALVGSLSARQLICIALAVLIDVFVYTVYVKTLGLSVEMLVYVIILFDLPILAFGWVEISGMPLEKYLTNVILRMLLNPANRKAVNCKKTHIEKEYTKEELKEIKSRKKQLKMNAKKKYDTNSAWIAYK